MSKNSKKKKIPNSKIPQIFCWKSGNMSQAPLRLPQRDRRGDARFGTKSRVCNSTDGAPSCIDYQSTIMPTGAHNFKRQHVHTRRAPRGRSQPGEEAGGSAGRRRAAPRQGPASHPLPGAYRLPGAGPPLPGIESATSSQIQSRGPTRRREAPTRRHPAARQIHTWGGGLARGENFTPWSRCQKMAEFQKNCRGACGKKKKTARSTSLKLREWLVIGGLRPPDTVLTHALKIRRRLAAPKFAGRSTAS